MHNVNKLVEELTTFSTINESWWDRYFKGHDTDSIIEITDTMKNKIHTEDDKKKAIEEIDELIDNSNRVFTPSSFPTFVADLGLSFTPAPLIKLIVRLGSSEERSKYKEALLKIRSQIQSMKVKK
jgi:hypothetical protein